MLLQWGNGNGQQAPDSNYLMTAGSWQQLTRLSTTISASDAGRGEAIATEGNLQYLLTRWPISRLEKSPSSISQDLPAVRLHDRSFDWTCYPVSFRFADAPSSSHIM